MPAISVDEIGVGQLGRGQRRRQVVVPEHRCDVVVDHPKRRRDSPIETGLTGIADVLFDDDDTIMNVDSAHVGFTWMGRCPLAQRGVALRGAVRVADLDVVAGQRDQGVDVGCIQGVVPRQYGGHLRCGHAVKRTACVQTRGPVSDQIAPAPRSGDAAAQTVHAPPRLLPALHVEAVAPVDDDAGAHPVGEHVGVEFDELRPLGQHQNRVGAIARFLD
jgi:hypothetical protein